MEIDIYKAIQLLAETRRVFTSEADFQLELAWQLKALYPDAQVRMEYCPPFDKDMHIDILVIKGGKWIPIELKYKTRKCVLKDGEEQFALKDHSAKDVNCYLYLFDIHRIERIKKACPQFVEGYTVMLTNELSYSRPPMRSTCNYADFSLQEGAIKRGTMNWGKHTGPGTMRGCEAPIVLSGEYPITWNIYSKVDESVAGTFIVLVNRII